MATATTAFERGQVCDFLVRCGFTNSPQKSNEDLKKRVLKLPDLIETGELAEPEGDDKDLLDEMCQCGDELVIEGEAPKKKKKAGTKDAKASSKNGKAAKKPATGKAAKGESSAARDAYGTREGTELAKINAQLSKTPKSMRELMEASGVETTHYNHLNRLVESGKIKKDKDGKYCTK